MSPNETVLALFKCLMIGWQEAGEGEDKPVIGF